VAITIDARSHLPKLRISVKTATCSDGHQPVIPVQSSQLKTCKPASDCSARPTCGYEIQTAQAQTT